AASAVPQPVGHTPPWQSRLPGQGTGASAAQLPAPLQTLTTTSPPVHAPPHAVPADGYRHAPLDAQPVEPHTPPVTHAAAQQVALSPQMPLTHSESAEQPR